MGYLNVDTPTRTCRSRFAVSAARSVSCAIRSLPGLRRTCRTGRLRPVNNLIKRVKLTAFGFHRFDLYRICALLYAG